MRRCKMDQLVISMLYEMRVRWIVTGVISAWNLSLKLLSSILDVWPLMSFICINLWHLCPRHSSLAVSNFQDFSHGLRNRLRKTRPYVCNLGTKRNLYVFYVTYLHQTGRPQRLACDKAFFCFAKRRHMHTGREVEYIYMILGYLKVCQRYKYI